MPTNKLPDWLKWMVPFAVPIAAAIAAAWLATHLNRQEIMHLNEKIDREIKHHEDKGPHNNVADELKSLCWENVFLRSRIRALEKKAGLDPLLNQRSCTP